MHTHSPVKTSQGQRLRPFASSARLEVMYSTPEKGSLLKPLLSWKEWGSQAGVKCRVTAFKVSGANWGCSASRTTWATASCTLSLKQSRAVPRRGRGQVRARFRCSSWPLSWGTNTLSPGRLFLSRAQQWLHGLLNLWPRARGAVKREGMPKDS